MLGGEEELVRVVVRFGCFSVQTSLEIALLKLPETQDSRPETDSSLGVLWFESITLRCTASAPGQHSEPGPRGFQADWS